MLKFWCWINGEPYIGLVKDYAELKQFGRENIEDGNRVVIRKKKLISFSDALKDEDFPLWYRTERIAELVFDDFHSFSDWDDMLKELKRQGF